MRKFRLSVLVFSFALMAGVAASAEDVSLSCGQSYQAGPGSCDGTVRLECTPYGATLRFSFRACHYFKMRNDNGWGYLATQYPLALNGNYQMKVTNDQNGNSGIRLTVNTAFESGPLPPVGGPLPPPGGPLPPVHKYSRLDEPRAYYQTNVFASNSRWIQLTTPEKEGCGGSVAVFFPKRVVLQGVSECSIGDIYDASGNLIQREGVHLQGPHGNYSGEFANLYETYGRDVIYIKLHSGSYEHGSKIKVYLTK